MVITNSQLKKFIKVCNIPDLAKLIAKSGILLVNKLHASLVCNGTSYSGILYKNNTPVSSVNNVAGNFQSPIAGFTLPKGYMDKDSTLLIDMFIRVFDTVSATRIVRVFANTQQIAAYSFTSTSGSTTVFWELVIS